MSDGQCDEMAFLRNEPTVPGNVVGKKFVDNPRTFEMEGAKELGYKAPMTVRFEAKSGGESGIRTHDTVARIPVFETGAFVRSAISPRRFRIAQLALSYQVQG